MKYHFNMTVRGRGQFPLDQLRRFELFPTDIETVAQIEESFTGLSRTREYTLAMNANSLGSDGPCIERFKSFGFICTTNSVWKDGELFEQNGEVVALAVERETALKLRGSINWEQRP